MGTPTLHAKKGALFTGSPLSPLQERRLFEQLLGRNKPKDEARLNPDETLICLTAFALVRTRLVDSDQLWVMMDAMETKLRNIGRFIEDRYKDHRSAATDKPHTIGIADRRYATCSGFLNWIDLATGEQHVTLTSPAFEMITYNLDTLADSFASTQIK